MTQAHHFGHLSTFSPYFLSRKSFPVSSTNKAHCDHLWWVLAVHFLLSSLGKFILDQTSFTWPSFLERSLAKQPWWLIGQFASSSLSFDKKDILSDLRRHRKPASSVLNNFSLDQIRIFPPVWLVFWTTKNCGLFPLQFFSIPPPPQTSKIFGRLSVSSHYYLFHCQHSLTVTFGLRIFSCIRVSFRLAHSLNKPSDSGRRKHCATVE